MTLTLIICGLRTAMRSDLKQAYWLKGTVLAIPRNVRAVRTNAATAGSNLRPPIGGQGSTLPCRAWGGGTSFAVIILRSLRLILLRYCRLGVAQTASPATPPRQKPVLP